MASVRKRGPEVRRSARDRNGVYNTLDENIMGIRRDSALFQQILQDANESHHHGLYEDEGRGRGMRRKAYRDMGPVICHHHRRHDPEKRGGGASSGSDEDDEEEEDDSTQENRHYGRRNTRNKAKRSSDSARNLKEPNHVGLRSRRGVERTSSKQNVVVPLELQGRRRRRNDSGADGVAAAVAMDEDEDAKSADDTGSRRVSGEDFSPSMYERVKTRHQYSSGGSAEVKNYDKTNGESNNEAANEDDDEEDSEAEAPKRVGRPPRVGRPAKGRRIEDDDEVKEEEHEDEDDEEEDQKDDDEEEGATGPYRLRQKRAPVTRFDHKRDFPRSCRASSIYGGTSAGVISVSGAHYSAANGGKSSKKRRRHRRRRRFALTPSSGGSSSSTESSDNGGGEGIRSAHNDLKEEARFERRKLRSLQKGRKSLMPTNMSEKDFNSATMSVRQKLRKVASSSCADIDPMEMDGSVGFADIGGLTQHIQALKEVVVFPLLYPELFQRFDVTPPKGVLFYGPPGTGKTLVARALANECSRGDQKVAFFMRKGADCLSKWVGESERQLRLLFDQAYSMRPSIIFFDEIDGLAPVRSSRQDQIHSSIVSTLLALMDGLDKRGEIIVIGATNRLDSIDPALRRPGRFDREMRFDLPDKTARESILEIHTKSWDDCRPSVETFKWLAGKTSGYCGADLRSLCTEAVLVALRERFPHIYLSTEKLQIDANTVKIEKRHFEDSMRLIVPAARRDFSVISHQMNPRLSCFVEPVIADVMRRLPQGYVQRRNVDNLWGSELQRVVMALKVPPSVPAGRMILHGDGCVGQTTHFLPVLINQLDHLPVFSLACEQIFAQGHAEENIAQVVRSALRATSQGTPIVLLMPDVDVLELALPTTTWKMLISSLNAFNGFTSALVVASVQNHYEDCSKDIKRVFRFQDSFEILPPDESQRITYFRNIFDACLEPPVVFDASQYPQPPKASKELPVRKVSSEEYKELKLLFDQMHRQFRIFLRDVLGRLVRDRRFNLFNLPVDKEDAEDYYDIIQSPMCLSQMMEKIDRQAYTKKSEFLADIRLIMENALEYNPNRNMEDKTIRHNAIALMDMAEALFGPEFDDDRLCEKIETARLLEEAKKSFAGDDCADANAVTNAGDAQKPSSSSVATTAPAAAVVKQTRFSVDTNDKTLSNGVGGNGKVAAANRKRRRSRGYSFTPIKRRLSSSIVKKYKTIRSTASNEEEIETESHSDANAAAKLMVAVEKEKEVVVDERSPSTSNNIVAEKFLTESPSSLAGTPTKNGSDNAMLFSPRSSLGANSGQPEVKLDVAELEKTLDLVVRKTSGWCIPDIECMGAQLAQCIESRCEDWERVQLPSQLIAIIYAFQL